MCNPRRVRIHTVEQLAEAWTTVLVGAAVASGDATAEAFLTQPYGENLPPAFRAIFERRLASDPAWSYHEGVFRAEFDSGYITYDPETGELEFRVRLTERVETEGQGRLEVSGTLEHTLDERFTGKGPNRVIATEKAWQASKAALDGERRRLRAEARAARVQAGQDAANVTRAERLAQEDAEQRLEEALGRRTEELSARAHAELEIQRNECLRLVNRVYAGALQEVMEAFARQRGAFNFESSEHDGIIDISFEMEKGGLADVRIKVKISFNPENGQYMQFRVESDGVSVPDGTHDDLHERITREIASEIDDNPEVLEEVPGAPGLTVEEIIQANAAIAEMLGEDRASG